MKEDARVKGRIQSIGAAYGFIESDELGNVFIPPGQPRRS
jgi:exoribonuclease II